MRTFCCLFVSAILLASCGNDPDSETKRPHRDLRQGETLKDTIRTKESYEVFLNDHTWTEDVDDLPRGMEYETIDITYGKDDRLEIEYKLSIGKNVPTGRYRFRVKYEFTGTDFFEETVRLKFLIHVERGRAGSASLTLRRVDTPDEAPHRTGDGETLRHVHVRLP